MKERRSKHKQKTNKKRQSKLKNLHNVTRSIAIFVSDNDKVWSDEIKNTSGVVTLHFFHGINNTADLMHKLKELKKEGKTFSCIVLAPSHGCQQMLMCKWSTTMECLSEAMSFIAENELTLHVHFETCWLGHYSVEYMTSPLIEHKVKMVSGYDGTIAIRDARSLAWISNGCYTSARKDDVPSCWRVSDAEDYTEDKRDGHKMLKSGTKYSHLNHKVKEDLAAIFLERWTNEEDACKFQDDTSSKTQEHIMGSAAELSTDPKKLFVLSSLDEEEMRKVAKKGPVPAEGSVQWRDYVAAIETIKSLGPIPFHFYADLSKMSKKPMRRASDLVNSVAELNPEAWRIDELHPIYRSMLQIVVAYVKQNKACKVVLLPVLTLLFKDSRDAEHNEKHLTKVVIQWNSKLKKVTAEYEDLGYTAHQRVADFNGRVVQGKRRCLSYYDIRDTVIAHDTGKTFSKEHRLSHRLYSAVKGALEAVDVPDMQHTQIETLQGWHRASCAIAIMFDLHFQIPDKYRHAILNNFRYHPDYAGLYTEINQNAYRNKVAIEDRTPQRLLMQLYDQWLAKTHPTWWTSAEAYALVNEITSLDHLSYGVCRICNQTDTPELMMLCENKSCPIAKHQSCGDVHVGDDDWFCETCAVHI